MELCHALTHLFMIQPFDGMGDLCMISKISLFFHPGNGSCVLVEGFSHGECLENKV
jgi:hypothetical protein